MTRSGAVSENLSTGEAAPISSRPADDSISEQPVNTAGKVLDRADVAHTHRSSNKAAKKAKKTVTDGVEVAQRPFSRLPFSDEEKPSPDLQKSIRKSDKAADKLKGSPAKHSFVGERRSSEMEARDMQLVTTKHVRISRRKRNLSVNVPLMMFPARARVVCISKKQKNR